MLSRVAETIFWLGRYMERTNGMLQVLKITYISSQDSVSEFSWRPILQLYGELTPDEVREIELSSPKVLQYLVLDKTNGASIYNNVRQSRENARAIQDHITKEVWQCLNDFYHFIRDPEFEKNFENDDPVSMLDLLIKQALLFTGTIKNTMTRGESYTYLHLGKFLERAILTSDIIRLNLKQISITQPNRFESPALRYLLYTLLGYEMYTKTYKGNFNAQDVLEMVVYNPLFPHSLMYSLYQLTKYFKRLQPESLPDNYEQVEFVLGKTLNTVKYSNLKIKDPAQVDGLMIDARMQLVNASNCLGKYYFGNS